MAVARRAGSAVTNLVVWRRVEASALEQELARRAFAKILAENMGIEGAVEKALGKAARGVAARSESVGHYI